MALFEQPRIALLSLVLLSLISCMNCLDIYYEWIVTGDFYSTTSNLTVSLYSLRPILSDTFYVFIFWMSHSKWHIYKYRNITLYFTHKTTLHKISCQIRNFSQTTLVCRYTCINVCMFFRLSRSTECSPGLS